ncbi:MAG: hypothetical protein MK135_12160 [Polyangiaceae bacterium]|nr:hypothetical protein [Polyangiaceae bacterium]
MSQAELDRVLTEIIAPLIEADDGELYSTPEGLPIVRLHLKGRFAGCPGNQIVESKILQPLIQAAYPEAQLIVSSGAIVPSSAERVIARNNPAPETVY